MATTTTTTITEADVSAFLFAQLATFNDSSAILVCSVSDRSDLGLPRSFSFGLSCAASRSMLEANSLADLRRQLAELSPSMVRLREIEECEKRLAALRAQEVQP